MLEELQNTHQPEDPRYSENLSQPHISLQGGSNSAESLQACLDLRCKPAQCFTVLSCTCAPQQVCSREGHTSFWGSRVRAGLPAMVDCLKMRSMRRVMSSSMDSVAARSIQKYRLAKYPERTSEATVSSKQNSTCAAANLRPNGREHINRERVMGTTSSVQSLSSKVGLRNLPSLCS